LAELKACRLHWGCRIHFPSFRSLRFHLFRVLHLNWHSKQFHGKLKRVWFGIKDTQSIFSYFFVFVGTKST
jgi:hypothetical protein